MKYPMIVAAVMLSFACGPAAAQVTPHEILAQLFRENQTGNGGPTFAPTPTEAMRKRFSKSFVSAWANAWGRDRGYPVVEGNPMTGSQSDRPQQLLSIKVEPAKDPYANPIGEIMDAGAKAPHKVRYTFIWEDSSWKIDEIQYLDFPKAPAPDLSHLKASLEAVR
jgi:hypothetical protein